MSEPTTLWIDAGLLEYRQALALQEQLVRQRIAGELERDVVLALEHPPVFTLGSRGGLDCLKVSPEFLQERGVEIVETGRGGVMTYHGPGQLVLYPIVKLTDLGLKVGDFVDRLEELMIRVCADFGIGAQRDARNRGIWVGNDKLGSLGIRVRRSVSFHGLALNVNTDLTPFGWIDPCGLVGTAMTTLETLTRRTHSMADVRQRACDHYGNLLGQAMETAPLGSVYAEPMEDQ